MQETQVRSLGLEDSLEKEMATHSNILSWRIPWTEQPGGLWGPKESDTTERLHFLSTSLSLSYQGTETLSPSQTAAKAVREGERLLKH